MTIVDYLHMYRYLAIFLGAFFEGPIVMAATGFLIKLGVFDLIPAYFLLIAGDMTADVAWYYVGYFGTHKITNKIGKFIGFSGDVGARIDALFRKYDTKIILISKMTMGFGLSLAILITAGMSRVPLKKFISLNLLGGLVWVAFMVTLGYFFGNIYFMIEEGQRVGYIIFLIIALVLTVYGLARYMSKKFLKDKL